MCLNTVCLVNNLVLR